MVAKHIAQSGAKAGQWVTCTAVNCRLTPKGQHTSSEELNEVKAYIQRTTGKDVPLSSIPPQTVFGYRVLSDTEKYGKPFIPVETSDTRPVQIVWTGENNETAAPVTKAQVSSTPIPVSDPDEQPLKNMTVSLEKVKTDFLSQKLVMNSLETLKNNGCEVFYTKKRRLLTVSFDDLEISGPPQLVSQWATWATGEGLAELN